MTVSAKDLDARTVVSLLEEGGDVLCPICASRLQPIPSGWQRGMRLSGVECPQSQQHYLTLLDDADAARIIRSAFGKRRDLNSAEAD